MVTQATPGAKPLAAALVTFMGASAGHQRFFFNRGTAALQELLHRLDLGLL